MNASPTADVPVVDIAPFFDSSHSDRELVAKQVAEACERIGFVLIAGHGVDQRLIDRYFEVSARFFRLPLDQKLEVKSPIDQLRQGYACPGNGPGYHSSERQSYNVQRYDSPQEAIAHGYPEDIDDLLHAALWPREPAEFRDVWRQYFEEMESLAGRILRVFEAGLGLEYGWFADKVDKNPSTLVANYYSNDIDAGHEPSPYRFKAHVDGSVLTILYQDDGPGSLQLHQRGRGWRNVEAVPGTYVVNIGELMARWTNDRFVATPHRVLTPTENTDVPRMSNPFFLKTNLDAVTAPIESLLAPGEEPKYEPVTGRGWLTKDQADIYAGYDSTVQFEEAAAANPGLR